VNKKGLLTSSNLFLEADAENKKLFFRHLLKHYHVLLKFLCVVLHYSSIIVLRTYVAVVWTDLAEDMQSDICAWLCPIKN
jgi:hypothetical protein